MITKLNLSTHPFRNRTLPYLIALFLLGFAVVGATLSFAHLRDINGQNQIAEAEIKEMETDIDALKGKGEKVRQQLSPDQQALLVSAHKVVANKSFSWSHLFADLERVLPGSVSASRISVQNVYKDEDRTKAELEFAVLSRNYQSVLTMIENMNNSGVFQAELRGQDLQKTERIVYTEYTLRLIYTSSYATSPAPVDVASADSARGETNGR